MPGISLKHSPALRGGSAYRNHTALYARAGSVALGLGLLCSRVAATENSSVPSPVPTPEITVTSHLTDGQNRLGSGKLNLQADALSQANALYTKAILSLEDSKNNIQGPLDLLRQVSTLQPHFADAQVEVANLLLQLGQIEGALAQLQAATLANPHSVEIEAALAYVQHLRGQNEEAVRLGKDTLTKTPTQPTAMRVLLEVAGEQEDLSGGVLHIEDILRANDSSVPASAWLTLAKLYVDVARTNPHPPNAETLSRTLLPIYQEAAAKPPPEVETLTLLSDNYRDLGRKREALKTAEQAEKIDPANVDVLLRCADLETDLGEKTAALKHYETVYGLSPGLTGLRDTLSNLYLDNQRFEDAARLACPIEPYLQIAGAALAHNELTKAAATLTAAQKRFPDSAKIRFYEAIQHRSEKNYPAALACLEQTRSLAIGPEAAVLDVYFYLECAATMQLAGEKDRFAATLHEGLQKFPNSADLMNELAYFWAEEGTHLTEALALSKRAAELDPENGPIQDTRGWVSFQMGDAKDALPFLQRAAILTNNDPVVLQHLGDTYLKLGLRSDAIATWRLGLEKAPRNGDLANRIDAALAQAKNAHTRSAPTP